MPLQLSWSMPGKRNGPGVGVALALVPRQLQRYNVSLNCMFARPNPDTVRQLMAGLRRGDKDAAGQLVEIFYPELKRLAAARMKAEPSDHTWQPTVLVN